MIQDIIEAGEDNSICFLDRGIGLLHESTFAPGDRLLGGLRRGLPWNNSDSRRGQDALEPTFVQGHSFGSRASRPRTARSAVPPRDERPAGKAPVPCTSAPPHGGAVGLHGTNSKPPDGKRLPMAQSRAGRPRSGGCPLAGAERRNRAGLPGPRASCPRFETWGASRGRNARAPGGDARGNAPVPCTSAPPHGGAVGFHGTNGDSPPAGRSFLRRRRCAIPGRADHSSGN